MTDHTERWLPVRRFEGFYEVSSLGRVRSVNRTISSRNRWGPIAKHLQGKVLTQTIDTYGYLRVTLVRKGKSKPYKVHRLVGEAFLGPLPPGLETLHGPNGRQANAVTDIRYGTRAENEQDKIRDGTFRHGGDVVIGERNGNSKLTVSLVTEIRKQYAAGQRQVDLAHTFGITQATVSQIIQRKTWKHVT